MERGRLVTEAYIENEADPILIKRAKALEKILSRMTIFINGFGHNPANSC